MRKITATIFVLLFVLSCTSYRTLDLGKLTTGMTKSEVISVIGKPQRVLAVNDTKDGFQEILEYRTARDEIYALEFWNDNLTGYEFLYDDINYVPPIAPPYWYPQYGRPIVVYPIAPDRPNAPSRPTQPSRPNQPNRPSRPETNQPNVSRPGQGSQTNSSTRPGSTGSSSSSNSSRSSSTTGGSGNDR